MDNIIAVIQAWFKDRQNKENKKRSWKEYFKEKKRLWTDTEEYKKIFTIETWKNVLKEVPKKIWRKIRWKMFILIAIVVLGFISEYVG
jgi:uncharacterized membrane protein YraQ (UPF0718 family)